MRIYTGCARWLGGAAVLAWSAMAACAVTVGVFDIQEQPTIGRRLVSALEGVEGLTADAFGNLDHLPRYEVLVFPGTSDVGRQSAAWRDQVVAHVGQGGGVVLLSFSCGWLRPRAWARDPGNRSKVDCLFPTILSVAGASAKIETLPVRAGAASPLLEGLADLSVFQGQTAYPLTPGPRGDAPVRYGERALIVTGVMGAGRVVGIGVAMGMDKAAPEYEKRLLSNAVRWAAQPVPETLSAEDDTRIQRARLNMLLDEWNIQRRAARNRAALGLD